MQTGIAWLDEVVASSKFPKLVDTEGAGLILSQMFGFLPSPETIRRWPIPYRLVGKTRRYCVDDVLAFAHKRLEESPMRRAAAPRSRNLSTDGRPDESATTKKNQTT